MKHLTPPPALRDVLQKMIEEEAQSARDGQKPLEPTDFRATSEMLPALSDTLPN